MTSNNCCVMGLWVLTRGRSCATSRRSQRTWQCGDESVCDTLVVLSLRGSRFSSVWTVVATEVLSSDRVCRHKNRKLIYNASVPKPDAALWSERAAHCVLQLAANWQRRVMEVAESRAGCCCSRKIGRKMDSSERRTVVAEIAAGDFDASSAVGKPQDSLRARDGAREVHWRALPCPFPNTDVEEIEGCDNTIQHISKLAPSMSWILLSARVVTKKLIAFPPTRAAKS